MVLKSLNWLQKINVTYYAPTTPLVLISSLINETSLAEILSQHLL